MIYSNISGLKNSFDYIRGPRNIRFAVFSFAGVFTSAGTYFADLVPSVKSTKIKPSEIKVLHGT